MSARRIVYVIGQLGAGGTERQLLELIRRIDRARFEPEVVTFTPGGVLEGDFGAMCPLHVLPKSHSTEGRVLFGLTRILRSRDTAIVHASLFPANWRGGLAATVAGGLPFIASVRNLTDWMGTGRRFVEAIVFRRAAAIIVNSEAIARDLATNAGTQRRKIHVIPNGVDLDRFHPRTERAAGAALPDSAGGRILVGAVMSLTRKKNPELLIDAARRVIEARPGVRFVIAGEGPLRAGLESRIVAAGLSGKLFLAGLSRDISGFLRTLDLLVLGSEREGLPNVILEAMATGLPVVATAVGGTPEIVRDGVSGRLVPPRDPGALSRAILEILADSRRAAEMGEAGRRLALADYGLERMVERTQELYERVIACDTSFARRPAPTVVPGVEGK